MENLFVLFAGLAGFAGVATGAAGAHGIADPMVQDLLQTASRFLMIHAVALFALSGHLRQERSTRASGYGLLTISGWLLVMGMALFGGGLIVHALTGNAAIAIVVPFGGTALMLGWLAVAAYGAGLAINRRRAGAG